MIVGFIVILMHLTEFGHVAIINKLDNSSLNNLNIFSQ